MRSFIFVLLLLANICSAQEITAHYNKNWELVPAHKKSYTRKATFDAATHSFVGAVTDTYKKGQLQMTGQYKSKVKDGVFTFYYENGNVELTGSFNSDIRVGLWKYYYANGSPKLEIEFLSDGSSNIKFLNDSIGNPLLKDGTGKWIETVEVYNDKPYTLKGDFVDNQMNGIWTIYSSKGKKLLEEKYNHGIFLPADPSKQRKIYPLSIPFKLVVTEAFMTDNYSDLSKEQSSILVKKMLPVVNNEEDEKKKIETEEATKRARIDSANARVVGAAFPLEGLAEVMREVSRHFVYPDSARVAGVGGDVMVQFTVQPDGRLDNFTVVKSIGSGCEEAVLNAWTSYAKNNVWLPARQNSQAVKQRFAMKYPCSASEEVYTDVDEQPSAKGGANEIMRFINANMKYPPAARQKRQHGTVFLEYIVEIDGRITDIKITKGIGPECDAEAYRVWTAYSAKYVWNPGKKDGKFVRVRMSMPVKFVLN